MKKTVPPKVRKAERAEMKALAGGASRAKAEKVEQKVLRRKGGSRR
jgi:hypothetical protein